MKTRITHKPMVQPRTRHSGFRKGNSQIFRIQSGCFVRMVFPSGENKAAPTICCRVNLLRWN